jgi:hypothetical protein
MINTTKIIIKLLPEFIKKPLKKWNDSRIITKWQQGGANYPPPHVLKQRIIAEYQKQYNYSIFIETGTYLGSMVYAQKKRFSKIYSIELGYELYLNAKQRFKNNKNIHILQGDSGKVLPLLMTEIDAPAIFWLDGHYSAGITAKGEKDCPIFEELEAIFNASKYHAHVLLIDDARLFIGKSDYPTIDTLLAFIKNRNNLYQLEIKNDVIRIAIPAKLLQCGDKISQSTV